MTPCLKGGYIKKNIIFGIYVKFSCGIKIRWLFLWGVTWPTLKLTVCSLHLQGSRLSKRKNHLNQHKIFQVLLLLVSERVINAGFVCFGWVILGESMTYSREISAVWWSILDLARLGFGNIFSQEFIYEFDWTSQGWDDCVTWYRCSAPPHSPVLTQKLYFALWRDNRGKSIPSYPQWNFKMDTPNWVVFSKILYFHPYWGTWSNLTNVFLMGWNHQLV